MPLQGPFAQREGYRILTPGDPDDSELWRRIIATDPDEQMPPPESRHEPLSDLQRQKMKEWISQGAKYEAFLGFRSTHQAPTSRSFQSRVDEAPDRSMGDERVGSKRHGGFFSC